MSGPSIIVHAGVSNRRGAEETAEMNFRAAEKACRAGWALLTAGGTALDAVETAIRVMEDSGHTNSGRGAVSQSDGVQRLDAALMTSDLRCGSVAQLEGHTHAISAARYLLEQHEGVDHIFYSQAATADLTRNLAVSEPNGPSVSDPGASDTVGCVALDARGDICAGTSTGGRGNCAVGRIGDTPVIGAGTYANRAAGVSMTGWGENIVRVGAARHCVQLVEDGGYSPEVACRKTIRYYQNHIYRPRAEPVGIICIDGTGRFGVSQTGVRMSWVHVGKEGYDSLQSAGKYSGELIRSRL